MTSSAYTEKDYQHAIQATINNPSMSSKRKELGEMIFKNVPRHRLAEYFIGLIKHVNGTPNIQVLKVKNEMTVLSVLVQSFLAWLLGLKYSKGKNHRGELSKDVEEIEDELAAVEDAESVGETFKSFPNAIQFSESEKREITEMLAKLEFPSTNKVLHLAIKSMDITPEMVVEIVHDLAQKGQASFSSLIVILSEPILNKLPLWPELLIQCVLLGPVTATQVESYAAPLKEDERKIVRDNLIAAEKWACSNAAYTEAFEKYTHRSSTTQPSFDVYRNRVLSLMADLKHKNRNKTTIDSQAAMGIIRSTAIKRYKKNEANNEQLLDLIFNVLKHQPNLKSFVIKLIEKTYNDIGLASRIKQLDVRNTKLTVPFADVDIYEIREKYLSIPRNVNVNFVNNAAHLKILCHQLDEISKSDYPYVGLDAEWSPYLSKSRASILQLALEKVIYIIDLDALYDKKELQDFFLKLFGNEKICKIGFRFSEDLMQLRACSPNCLSLYEPKNLICIQTLFFDLVNTCHNTIGNDLDGLVVASAEPFVANPEIAALEIELANPEFDKNDIIRTREKLEILLEGYKERDKIRQSEQDKDIALGQIKYMGLASVCARVLGKKLDKSEQCSVWDRRPLRKTQLRYAALDAFCILMILDKFLNYCKQKNLDIKPLIAKQPSLKAALPLFFTVS
uniref:3'-5' exonuclease domain-containing protein n=1 Tax=Panagrolaimus davidi TaxID=227884 RepID=A0A914QTD9_9BILA